MCPYVSRRTISSPSFAWTQPSHSGEVKFVEVKPVLDVVEPAVARAHRELLSETRRRGAREQQPHDDK
jgi:hypothetical protein